MFDIASHVCGMTGKVTPGAGVDFVEAQITDDIKVRVTVFVQAEKGKFVQAKISPEAAAKAQGLLSEALKKVVPAGAAKA